MKRGLIDWLKLLGWIVAVVGMVLGSYEFFGRSDFFRLRGATLTGDLKPAERERLLRLAEIPYGENLFLVNIYRIAHNLKRNPAIKDIRIRRKFPDFLTIHVEKYQPRAVLVMENDFYLVSREGIVFKKINSGSFQDLPRITGFHRKRLEKFPGFYGARVKEAIDTLLLFAESVQEKGLVVSGMDYDVTEGVSFEISPKENFRKVCRLYLGRGDPGSKIRVFVFFLEQMQEAEQWYRSIDLHVEGRIFARQE